MRVKEVLLIAILILVTLVYAAPNAVINITPVSVYETNEPLFNITVNNWFGSEVIDQVEVTVPFFTITNVVNFIGWESNHSDGQVSWSNGDIETNSNTLFQFNAKAALVDHDSNADFEVKTRGESGEVTSNIIEVIVLNDNSTPVLTGNIPANNSYLRQGIHDQLISVNAEDLETGILNSSFSYWDCSANATNVTTYSIDLDCVNSTCTNVLDLSDYEEGDRMCFEFVVYNNALDASRIAGDVGFDGTAPTATLNAPADGAYAGSSTEFKFIADDNLAPTMQCEWRVDDVTIQTVTANDEEETTVAYNMSDVEEGDHDWEVRCTDSVGLIGDSEARSITVDKTAPVITLASPADGSMIGDGVVIDIDVADNYEVDSITYSSSLDSADLPEGENTITVTATDKAGNTAVSDFTFIVDKTSPTISIVSPENDTSSDVHVGIAFDTDDNLDEDLECSLYTDGTLSKTDEFSIDDTANMNAVIPVGDYIWNLVCRDEAGNAATTEGRLLHVVDLTGPDVVSDIVYVARSEDYPVSAEITDPSGVNTVDMTFDGKALAVVKDGDNYNSVIQTNSSYALGDYDLTIATTDSLGNSNTDVDSFELIQGYAMTLSLSASEVDEGQAIVLTGTAVLDDGGDVPEEVVTLYLPAETVNVSLEDGAFSYGFTAPSAGTYTIRAVIVSSEGFEHAKTVSLTVRAPPAVFSSGSGGGSHRIQRVAATVSGGLDCGDGSCSDSIGEDCNSCPQDCGICPIIEETPEPAAEEAPAVEEEVAPEEPRSPAGVGSASSWFKRVKYNFDILILFAMIVTLMYIMVSKNNGVGKAGEIALEGVSFAGRGFKKAVKGVIPKKKVNWKGYFEK